MPNFWRLKTEPTSCSYADLERDKRATWDGVDNTAAVGFLRNMKKGDQTFIYHTGDQKSIVRIAQVTSDAYPDPKFEERRKLGFGIFIDSTEITRHPHHSVAQLLQHHGIEFKGRNAISSRIHGPAGEVCPIQIMYDGVVLYRSVAATGTGTRSPPSLASFEFSNLQSIEVYKGGRLDSDRVRRSGRAMRRNRDVEQALMRLAPRVAACWMLLSSPVAAQTVELRLRDEATRAPIAGAIVRLIRNDTAVVQGLTNELGLLVLRAAHAGSYRLKVDRIGFSGFVSAPFTLDAGERLQLELPIASHAVSLPTLTVSGKSQCGLGGGAGAPTAALWEEVRKALTANLITQRQEKVPLHVREFQREVARSGKIRREWVFSAGLTRGQPFATYPAPELARLGFVHAEEDTTIYSVPDAALLLDDAFVATHCFRTVPDKGPLAGLGFEPVSGRKLPDVSGILWLERATSELKFLEYGYTALPGELGRADLGGRVEFRRLPTGAWIVEYWHVRMPWLELSELRGVGNISRVSHEVARMVGYLDRGGRTAIATDTTLRIDQAVLLGEVHDSTSGGGLRGAVVRVSGVADSTVTDSAGRFTLAVTASGDQQVTVSHPRLGLAKDATSRSVLLSLGDTTSVRFAMPSMTTFTRTYCGNTRNHSGLIGQVLSVDGKPRADLEVLVSWRTASGSLRTERGRSTQKGLVGFCDLEPDQPLTIRVVDEGQVLLEQRIQLGWKEFRWVELRPTR